MEEMIRQSEEKYRTIINEVDEWYFEIDLAGNVIFVDDAIVCSVGYPPERLIGLNYKSFTSKERSGEVFKIFPPGLRNERTNKKTSMSLS